MPQIQALPRAGGRPSDHNSRPQIGQMATSSSQLDLEEAFLRAEALERVDRAAGL